MRVPIPLISGKLSGQKCLKVKLGEPEGKKKETISTFWGVERMKETEGGREGRWGGRGGPLGWGGLISDDFFSSSTHSNLTRECLCRQANHITSSDLTSKHNPPLKMASGEISSRWHSFKNKKK